MLVGIERDIFHLLRLLSRLPPPSVSPTHTVRSARGRRSASCHQNSVRSQVVDPSALIQRESHPMITLLLHLLRLLPFLCGGRRQLALENLALRQQLAVYKRTMRRPKLRTIDRVFWVGLSQSLDRLETGSGLRVARHRLAMAAASLPRVLDPALRSADRRPTMRSAEIVALVRRMAAANPLWGAPRIHGELLKLGIDIAERTLSASCRSAAPALSDLADVPVRPSTRGFRRQRWSASALRLMRHFAQIFRRLEPVFESRSRFRSTRHVVPEHVWTDWATRLKHYLFTRRSPRVRAGRAEVWRRWTSCSCPRVDRRRSRPGCR
jgi:hypothetical protein